MKKILAAIVLIICIAFKPVYNPLEYIQTTPTRTLNTGFQISTTKWVDVNYTVTVASLVSVGQAIAYLEISPDNTSWTTLTAAGETSVALLNTKYYNLTGSVPANYYVRIRSAVTLGGTVTYFSGQEKYLP